ncbi:MAG: hypothetical protein ICV86_05635 [Microcoleus sp. T3-bin5]|nr:hypothetical protein [Microcoleus sp. T3-bin5]
MDFYLRKNAGLIGQEIRLLTTKIETITHLAFYAGWPNAVTAIGVAKEVFENKGRPIEGAQAPAVGAER